MLRRGGKSSCIARTQPAAKYARNDPEKREPWLIPPANPPAIELPIPPSSREQADKAFMSYQREEIWDPEVLTEGMTPPL